MLRRLSIISLVFICFSCVSVPKAAPELSENLGNELQELHDSHTALIHRFFKNKRQEIRDFIAREWLPVFSENFFDQPEISSAWNQVVSSGNKSDRIEFIKRVYPEIQHQADKRYQSLTAPLDALEQELSTAVNQKYNRARLINQTLTGYLNSAAKTSATRTHYLEKTGLDQHKIDTVISKADQFTDKALKGAENLRDFEEKFEEYKKKIQDLLSSF